MRIKVFVGAVLGGAVVAVLTTGPLYRIRSWWAYEDPLGRDPVVVAVLAVLGLVSIVIVSRRNAWGRLPVVPCVFIGALLGWLLLSAFWSLDPGTTVREVLLVAATLAAGMAVTASFAPPAAVSVWWAGIHVGLAWSSWDVWRMRTGSQDAFGHWTGIYVNRNSLALIAALGILFSAFLAVVVIQCHLRRVIAVSALAVIGVAAAADVVLVWRTGSASPVVALAAAGLAVVTVRSSRRAVRAGASVAVAASAALTFAVVLVVGLWLTRGQLADLLGRDVGLSGRSQVWSVALDWTHRRPVHGWGYLAAGTEQRFLEDVYNAQGMVLDTAHSTLMEVLLGAGIVGAVLLLGSGGALSWTLITRAIGGQAEHGDGALALGAFVLVEQLTETLLVAGHVTVALVGALLIMSSWSTSGIDRAGSPRVRSSFSVEVGGLGLSPGGVRAVTDPQ